MVGPHETQQLGRCTARTNDAMCANSSRHQFAKELSGPERGWVTPAYDEAPRPV